MYDKPKSPPLTHCEVVVNYCTAEVLGQGLGTLATVPSGDKGQSAKNIFCDVAISETDLFAVDERFQIFRFGQ